MQPAYKSIKLPIMQCDAGCGECCGPVMCSHSEFDRIDAYAKANGIEPKRQGTRCPFYQDGTCKVYDVRPFICRLFGHCGDMVCCKGYNVNIPPDVEDRVMAGYVQDIRRQGGPRMLHEFNGDGWQEELKAALEQEC